jgi:hypothetical protein
MSATDPAAIGSLLHAMLAPPTQDGPPYVHTFQHPEPVPVLDDDGQPMFGEAGEPVMRVPLLPTHTITRGPVFCFHANAVTEHRAYPARWVRKRKGRRWRLERRPSHAVFAMTCPACPAERYQLDMGMQVRMQMGPTLLLAPEGS